MKGMGSTVATVLVSNLAKVKLMIIKANRGTADLFYH